MDVYKFQKRKNRLVFSCWFIIALTLTIAYIGEYFLGNRTAYYVVQYCLFTWIPIIICYGISLIIGRGNLNIKYGIGISYVIFYIYTQITSQSLGTFCYIFPMMCALIVYDDVVLLDRIDLSIVATNVVYILYKVLILHDMDASDITFFEIQLACLILSSIFLHNTTKLLTYSDNKLLELNDNITRDELTNAHNRYFLNRFIDDKFKNPEYSELSLAVIDVDSFKKINDSYGHKFGDLVLRKIASILKDSIDDFEETHVIRIGGDEFIIVSALIDKDAMFAACEKACKEVSATRLMYGNTEVRFTVSIGVANSRDDNCESYSKLYEVADSMLYTVKNNGKSSVAKS